MLHTLAGKPMLAHVLDSARQLEPARIVVVVGHGAERVKQAFEGQADLHFALQQPQQAPATRCNRRCRCCSKAMARTT